MHPLAQDVLKVLADVLKVLADLSAAEKRIATLESEREYINRCYNQAVENLEGMRAAYAGALEDLDRLRDAYERATGRPWWAIPKEEEA